jgi:hypothetical protein
VLVGRVETANYLGGQVLYRIAAEGGLTLLVKQTSGGEAAPAVGAMVRVAWSAADAVTLEG